MQTRNRAAGRTQYSRFVPRTVAPSGIFMPDPTAPFPLARKAAPFPPTVPFSPGVRCPARCLLLPRPALAVLARRLLPPSGGRRRLPAVDTENRRCGRNGPPFPPGARRLPSGSDSKSMSRFLIRRHPFLRHFRSIARCGMPLRLRPLPPGCGRVRAAVGGDRADRDGAVRPGGDVCSFSCKKAAGAQKNRRVLQVFPARSIDTDLRGDYNTIW